MHPGAVALLCSKNTSDVSAALSPSTVVRSGTAKAPSTNHMPRGRYSSHRAEGDAASNDEEAWKALLALAARPQVHVKVSALFRTSAEPPPHLDLQPRVRELLAAYGASRLMWGSDFPFVLLGGQARNEYALDYKQAAAVPGFWRIPELDEEAHAQLMGGTAAKLFGFGA